MFEIQPIIFNPIKSFKSLQSVLETRIRELELKVEQSRIEMDNEQDRHEQYTQVLMEEKNQLENNSIRLRSSVDDAQQELEKSKFAHNAEVKKNACI